MKCLLSIFLLLLCLHATSQNETITVSGTVYDSEKEPLIGTSITIKGSVVAAMADIDGNYSISVPRNGILKFSFVGFESKEIPVNGKSKIDVELEEVPMICGHPIISYTLRGLQFHVSNGTSNLNAGILPGRPNNTESLLQGFSSGVFVDPFGNVNIKGGSSIACSEVMYVVDDVADAPFNPSDVVTSWVVKDIASEAVYGSHAASGGVVFIETNKNYGRQFEIEGNTWIGVQNASTILGSQSKKQYKDNLRSGLVQHYGIRADRRLDDKLILSTSVSYDNIEDVIPSASRELLTARLNIAATLYKSWKIDQNLFYSRDSQRKGFIYESNPDNNSSASAIMQYNPQNRIYSSTKLKANLFDNVYAYTMLTYDYLNSSGKNSLTDNYEGFAMYDADYDYRNMLNARNSRMRWQSEVSYINNFSDHRLSAYVSYILTKDRFEPNTYHPITDSYTYDVGRESANEVLARVVYNYNYGCRTASVSIRRSESSKLSSNKDYYSFPTATIGWDIAKERFYPYDPLFTKLRPKASWGRTGSTRAISPFHSDRQLYSDLKWIITDQREAGLDFNMFDDKLMVYTSYYYKKTYNLLEASNAASNAQIKSGSGVLRNEGWEVKADYNLRLGYVRGLQFSANFTHNTPKISYSDLFDRSASRLILGEYATPKNFYGLKTVYFTKQFDFSLLFQGALGLVLPHTMGSSETDYYGLKNLNISYKTKLGCRGNQLFTFFVNGENLLTKVNTRGVADFILPVNRMFSAGVKAHF